MWILLWYITGIFFNKISIISANNKNPLVFTTSNCTLNEPLYGHQFDFTKLRSDLAHLTHGSSGDVFKFNLCGNLTGFCRGISNTAACLKRENGKEYVLGVKHELNYRNGKMYFHFTNGDICPMSKNDETYQLFVFLSCDYTLDPHMFTVSSYSPNACAFYITFETPAACLPEPKDKVNEENNCIIKDPQNGHIYDLRPLSDNNYRTSDRRGNAFVINICKPVLYGENAMCPPGSSVCFISLKSNDYKAKFYDYGRSNGQLVIDTGRLMLHHTSLTPCNASTNYSSTIYFYCDKDAKNVHPELMGFHGCLYEFSFATPLACNDLAPCTAITHDNAILDLSSLKDKTFTLQQDKQNYKFSVCARTGEPCLESDGACLIADGQSTSMGTVNDNLRINQTGTPYLLYENGANCQTSSNETTKWSTKIEFICANGSISGSSSSNSNSNSNSNNNGKDRGQVALGPKVIENSNCRLLIHYQTELVCQEQISCKTKAYVDHSEDGTGMEIIDLTPLISTTENYEADIDANIFNKETNITQFTKFFLNVCRPLVPKYGLSCPGGSAACMATMDKMTGKPEEEQSLGFPLVSLVAVNRTSAELSYLLGGICPKDHNEHLSSAIAFSCDRKVGRGKPKLQQITDCHYQFFWLTNVICPPHLCIFNKDTCEIVNEEINVSYSLKKAPFTHSGNIMVTQEKHNFTLNLCDSHHKAVTDYSQNLVNLFFVSKGPCDGIHDGVINVQMRLICHSVNEPSTTFSECNLLYIQKTPDICKFLGLSVPESSKKVNTLISTTTEKVKEQPPNEKVKEEQPSTEKGETQHNNMHNDHENEAKTSKGTVLAVILSITSVAVCISMVAFSPQRRNTLRHLLLRTTSAVRYVRVNNDESNLLLEHNNAFTESDDDDMIL